jgi:1,4-dihydroxy-2-naphthoyl-CoA synthase
MVDEWCEKVADNAPLSLRALKKTANYLLPTPDLNGLAEVNAAIEACRISDDYKEGVRAFGEKRNPEFRGA